MSLPRLSCTAKCWPPDGRSRTAPQRRPQRRPQSNAEQAAAQAAAQAEAQQLALAAAQREHASVREELTRRMQERDQTVARLLGELQDARRQGVDAQGRATVADVRAQQEARRAQQTRRELDSVLDEVFGTALVDNDADRERALPPTAYRSA